MTRRSFDTLKTDTFDLVIVGGGIQGACLAWEGARRGLKIALFEKGDFGGATSANSLKILHGGLRYLQHMDFRRMNESIASRRYFAKFAPEFIKPLPCVIPTTRWGLKHPLPMKIALMLNDFVSRKRNQGLEAEVNLPNGSLLSPSRCEKLFPGIAESFVTGGARWYDYLILNSERLTLQLMKAAKESGAVVENYLSVDQIQTDGEQVTGVKVTDQLGFDGSTFDVKCNAMISCVGPWWNEQPDIDEKNSAQFGELQFAKAINLVINKKLLKDHAIGLEAPDPNDAGQKRFFFLVPWREGTMIGTTYRPVDGVDPNQIEVSENEIEDILKSVCEWFPDAEIQGSDVVLSHAGLLPIDRKLNKGKEGYRLHGDTTITHHRDLVPNGKKGLFSVKTVKYTTSPIVAEAFYKQYGSQLGSINDEPDNSRKCPSMADELHELGLDKGEFANQLDPEFKVTYGQVLYHCRNEMALTLLDVIYRRGVIDAAVKPTRMLLNQVAKIMADELQWSLVECKQEVDRVIEFYHSRGVELEK